MNAKSIFYKNRFTFMSLVVILFMVLVTSNYYDPNSAARQAMTAVTGELPDFGGDFELVKAGTGEPVTQDIMQGKYTLVYFGYTHCPDICPTALNTLSYVYEGLDDASKAEVQMMMVTVDPARDTVESLDDYVKAFGDYFIGLTGSVEQVKQIASNYNIFYKLGKPDDSGYYAVEHSGFLYLIGTDGRYLENFPHNAKSSDILSTLKGYLHK